MARLEKSIEGVDIAKNIANFRVAWRCEYCRKTTVTEVVRGHIFVPVCDHCKTRSNGKVKKVVKVKRRYTEGWIIDNVNTLAKRLTIVDDPAPRKKKRVMDMLMELFNATRARTAGGGWSDKFCALCENNTHTQLSPCRCVCHRVREFIADLQEAVA